MATICIAQSSEQELKKASFLIYIYTVYKSFSFISLTRVLESLWEVQVFLYDILGTISAEKREKIGIKDERITNNISNNKCYESR